MLRVFSRIRRNAVEIQIREVESGIAPQFTTTSLTGHHWCIHPMMREGVEEMCGQPSFVPPDHSGGTHGWFCRYHYFRTMLLPSEIPVGLTPAEHKAEVFDADNIAFIIEQDLIRMSENAERRLGRYRGWNPIATEHGPSFEEKDEPKIYH